MACFFGKCDKQTSPDVTDVPDVPPPTTKPPSPTPRIVPPYINRIRRSIKSKKGDIDKKFNVSIAIL